MNREKLGNRILTLTTIIALVFAIGGAILAVMCPITAHAAQATQTAHSAASGLTVVPTQQSAASSAKLGADGAVGLGLGFAIVFLLPMTFAGIRWCWLGDRK